MAEDHRVTKCFEKRQERLFNLFGESVEENEPLVYVAERMDDFNVFVPPPQEGKRSKYRLSRALETFEHNDLTLCIADEKSTERFLSKLSFDINCEHVELFESVNRLLITSTKVFIESGILDESGIKFEPQEAHRVCIHEYGSPIEFVSKELGVKIAREG